MISSQICVVVGEILVDAGGVGAVDVREWRRDNEVVGV
jgi:hypothetical protein